MGRWAGWGQPLLSGSIVLKSLKDTVFVSVSYRQKQFLEARKQKEEAEERIRAMRKNKLFRRIQADLKERDKKRKPGEWRMKLKYRAAQNLGK